MKTRLKAPTLIATCLFALTSCSPQPDNSEIVTAADSGSIPSGQFRLNYRIEGTGAAAIVIGFPNYYARVFSEDLRSHLRLIFVDHRGSAASPGSVDTAEFALERIVDDLELVRETLGLGRIVVIGHSGHAFMALEYAKKYPANVSHVVMIGIAPDFSASSQQVAQQNWLRLASPERKSALEENQRKITDDQLAQLPPGERWIKSYVRNGPRAWYDPHFDSTPLWEDVEVNMEMFNYVWGELFSDIDVTRGLENFDRPVFMALGRYDFLVAPPSSWEPIKDSFNDLALRIFEESGHTPQYEEPELFGRELLAWMKAHE
ncbi:MAG: alpha/beta hydrolase [Acidobacteriota bacterium]